MFTKRAIDIAISSVGLLLLSPLMAVIAALVKLTSSGPVIYSQARVGRAGKLFQIHKFRSMVREADSMGSSVTVDHDQRVTAIGRILRKTKLDELPQLWNVLRGEMSLVGPRPDVPEITRTYTAAMRRALEIRPGLTSIASLWLRNETDLLSGLEAPDDVYEKIIVPAKVELALRHVDRQSVIFDLGILFATVGAWLGVRPASKAEQQFLAELRRQVEACGTSRGREILPVGSDDGCPGRINEGKRLKAGL